MRRFATVEEDPVRKPPKQRTPHCAIDELIGFRMAPDGCDRRADRQDELVSDVRTLRVIPRVCVI